MGILKAQNSIFEYTINVKFLFSLVFNFVKDKVERLYNHFNKYFKVIMLINILIFNLSLFYIAYRGVHITKINNDVYKMKKVPKHRRPSIILRQWVKGVKLKVKKYKLCESDIEKDVCYFLDEINFEEYRDVLQIVGIYYVKDSLVVVYWDK